MAVSSKGHRHMHSATNNRFPTLAAAVSAAHVADQTLLAAIPLIVTASGQSAALVSSVVAAQAAAWLLVSLPAGLLADRFSRRTLMAAGAGLIVCGGCLGAISSEVGGLRVFLLAAAGFLCSAGVVLQVLSVFALLPRFTSGLGIARANAMLEICRALAAFGCPIIAAALVSAGRWQSAFLIAVVAGAGSLIAVFRLPREAPQPSSGLSIVQSAAEGARFVWQQPILRSIGLCAIAWNAAFFALAAALAPFARALFADGFEAITGQAWACYGAGALLGAAVAPKALKLLPTGFLFVFGPMSSVGGVLALTLLAPRVGAIGFHIGLFCLGFGPMLWSVLQTSVRQMLTPTDMLGRVAATLTMATFGARPIGALAAGAIASWLGTAAAVWLAGGLFALSLVAILLSPAPRLSALPAG